MGETNQSTIRNPFLKSWSVQKNDVNSNTNKFNYGLAILRIWMSFEVVLVHFKNWNSATPQDIAWPFRMLLRYCFIAVPVFMLTSFIFTDMSKLSTDKRKIKNRFLRLLVPHFFWAFAYFLIYKLLDMWKGLSLENGFSDLLWQLALGHSLNQTEWFQIDLIALTVVFILVFRIFKKYAIFITWLMGYLALYLQYSGKNGAIFDNVIWKEGFDPSYVIFPIGRIVEMLPFAVIGILICHYDILDKLKKYRYAAISISILSLYLLFNMNIFSSVERQYSYSGCYLILSGVISVILFYLIPLDTLPAIFKMIIMIFSKFTLSVYFGHRLIAALIYNTSLSDWFKMRPGSIHDCLIIYICCVIIAWLMSLIPSKYIRMAIK